MKINEIKNHIKKVPLRVWILVLIVAVGIFLRTYHFHDWLVFNPDQARDAKVVDDVLSGKSSWLILGPEAGNTHFQLGPWFYHMEIISAKIFGGAPDKMAYPDLFFSILSIPLFYIFLKKYFGTKLSLALTGLYSMSFFIVRYSRFAWNPNSIPFFVLLFLLGILYLMEKERKKSYGGAVMVGIGIGVGMQLHILLFFMMSFVAALFFLFLFFRKSSILPIFGKIGITLLFVLIANVGQIAHEMYNGGLNTRMFLKSSKDTTIKVKPGENLQLDLLCQAQANLYIISSSGNADQCDSEGTLQKMFADSRLFFIFPENKAALEIIVVGAIFSLAGYIFLAYFWRKETDLRKRNFLVLVGIYGLTTFIAFFPIMDQVELRYYVVSFFLPFVFLGIMANALLRFRYFWIKIAVALVFISLFALNGSTEAKTAENFFAKNANDENFSYLGETETMADYLIGHSQGSKTIYLRGERQIEKRYFKPLNYILAESGIDLESPSSDGGEMVSGAPTFFVTKTNYNRYWKGSKIGEYSRVDQIIGFGNISIVIPSADEKN